MQLLPMTIASFTRIISFIIAEAYLTGPIRPRFEDSPTRITSTMTGTGTLFTVSAPSGAGKTSLVNALIQSLGGIQVSISHTTRPKRPGEVEGKDYHFTSPEVFASMLEDSAFLEHAEVFGNFYGTSKQWVQDNLNSGTDVILEIDWQGAAQVRRLMPETVGIFILPPSMETLKERLNKRGQDDNDTIARRVAEAKAEIEHYAEAEYLIVNEDFDRALGELTAIITSQCLRTDKQQQRLQDVLQDLLS
jgi:guanylate kinase